MSTEFHSRTTQELGFVQWSGRRKWGVGTCFEFGTITNFENVCRALRAGDIFDSLGGWGDPPTVTSAVQLEQLAAEGRVTFGEFPVTVEVGSGELYRFTEEDTSL